MKITKNNKHQKSKLVLSVWVTERVAGSEEMRGGPVVVIVWGWCYGPDWVSHSVSHCRWAPRWATWASRGATKQCSHHHQYQHAGSKQSVSTPSHSERERERVCVFLSVFWFWRRLERQEAENREWIGLGHSKKRDVTVY